MCSSRTRSRARLPISSAAAGSPSSSRYVADASSVKVFGTEFYLEAFRLLFEVVGQQGYMKPGSADSVLKGRLERLYRSMLILTFGGGTNEIQRDLIAMFGLGLPRSLR